MHVQCKLILIGWNRSALHSTVFQFECHHLLFFFHTLFVMFGQRNGQREDIKTWNIKQHGITYSCNICFHFGVCFQLHARKYSVPKSGMSCFQLVIWHSWHFFYWFMYFFFFPSLSLKLIWVGKLSLVANHTFSWVQRSASAKKKKEKKKNCIFGSKTY